VWKRRYETFIVHCDFSNCDTLYKKVYNTSLCDKNESENTLQHEICNKIENIGV
jgi:hypothetical protein